jgi:AAA15 family ATPase/GTPase
MLRDITIENYRLFEKFQLEGLTQVNLVVGTNNSGKSSLLEAIYLLVNYEDQDALSNVLDNRFVIKSGIRSRSEITDLSDTFELSNIFRGHKLQQDYPIIITSQRDVPMSLECTLLEAQPQKNDSKTGIRLQFRGKRKLDYFLGVEQLFSPWYRDKNRIDKSRTNRHFLTTERLDQQSVTKLWNQIVLTPKEDMVLGALRILEPDLQRIALLNQPTPEMSVRLKVERGDDPVPLGSMGDGMYRIFALTLSLVSSENGVLLVDEIDTGLHYKALTKMWRLVIETAKKLNVQVFATTHSWDCLASFQAVLTEEKEETIGSVFRLERTNDRIGYVAYTGEELAVAVDHDIEVR